MKYNIKTDFINQNIKKLYHQIIIPSFVLLLVISITSKPNYAQNSNVKQVKDKCIKALKTNDINSFTSTFSSQVEISLPNNDNSYSNAQAKVVMKKFLKNNETKSFILKQSGKSTGGSEFIIAELTTKQNKKYQIYLLITLTNNKAFLHLIEFEII